MLRLMLRGKIHRATVTGANLDYEGSITIDRELLDRADILPYERVEVWNVTNGERFTTYALAAPAGSGTVCINGAAAHKARAGDKLIIACFGSMTGAQARRWKPRIVFVDEANRPLVVRPEITPDTEPLPPPDARRFVPSGKGVTQLASGPLAPRLRTRAAVVPRPRTAARSRAASQPTG